jgi:hypothetical protein
LTSRARLDTFGAMTSLVLRIAQALRETRPDGEGSSLELWSEVAVAIAAVLAEMDPGFDYGAFFTACGGL